MVYRWYTHKTPGFKTSGFKKFGFKTSEKSGLQNVRSSKSTGSVAAMFAGKVMAVFYSLVERVFCHISP
jgi:hypothetical protein